MTDKNATPAWARHKERWKQQAEAFESRSHVATISKQYPKLAGNLEKPLIDVIRQQVEREPYWFHKVEIAPGLESPGWSDPKIKKLPYYGLPNDLTGMRVLDIGCAEGFFSFEAEARGAREVIGIDSFPDSIRRFNLIREAKQSNASAYLMNVYDLDPKRLGTFDLVLFYGVFYHLKHPQLALEAIQSVCKGQLLFQTSIVEHPSLVGEPWAKYHPYGIMSGLDRTTYDPTVFWLFNSTACIAMLDGLGFEDISVISAHPNPFVLSAKAAASMRGRGLPPNQALSPWS